MLKINNVDCEFEQIGKEPTMGIPPEYVEKTMISGKIRRIYKGRRFYAAFSYAFLTEEQRSIINQLLKSQEQNGYVTVQIDSPFGSFSGQAILDCNQQQTRFGYSEVLDDYVWTNWEMTIKSVEYLDNDN